MSSHLALRASYLEGSASQLLDSAEDVLAVFEFGRSPLESSDSRHVPVALTQLGSPGQMEVWRSEGPIKTGSWDRLRFAQGEQLTMGHIALDLRKTGDMRESSRLAYDILQSYLQQSPHQWPLKIWNYIPGINQGSGDDELYRQFCLGRAEAVSIDPGNRPPLPAATGIGTPPDEPALQVYFLAGALPGHQTNHENQVANQLSESLRNVYSLLDEGHRLMGDSKARLDSDGILKVYIRNPEDYDLIRRTLEAEAPAEIPRIYLQGDICRESLLTEIDGIVSGQRIL